MKTLNLITCIFKLCISLFLFALPNVLGQETDLQTQKTLWRMRAETITNSLLKDAAKLEDLERALVLAKIGEAWWKSAPSQSNVWFEKAVDIISFYSPDEKTKKANAFDIARKILAIISKRNPKQSDRLVEILADFDKDFEKEKETNADTLMNYALEIVKENPQKATQIGILALKLGYPKQFYKLIWELRRSNIKLADQLLKESFLLAKTSRNYYMLQGIQYAVLPESQIPNFPNNLNASPQQKIEVLNFFADYLSQLQAGVTTKTIASCRNEAFLILRFKRSFDNYLPQRAGIVQQAIDNCINKQAQDSSEKLISPAKENTIEELLKLADENKDNRLLRISYLNKAVILANNQKKFDIIIKIFDGLSEEEIREDLNFWEEMRFDAAGNLAFLRYKENDFQGALKILKDTPFHLRPFAHIIFLLQFPKEESSNNNLQTEILDEARKGFIKSEKPFAVKSNYWFSLVRLYAANQLQNEASEVFKEIVKEFNSFSAKDSEDKATISSDAIVGVFSSTLFEAQEINILDTAGKISDINSRVNVNLAFLKIALQKHESLNSKLIPAKKTKAKSADNSNPKGN